MRNAQLQHRATGFALITALVMLLVITVLALGGARLALDSKRISRNQRDNSIAFQAAEAALRDAERDIENAGNVTTSRSANFSNTSKNGFPDSGCYTGGPESAPRPDYGAYAGQSTRTTLSGTASAGKTAAQARKP
ncbi:hypothetical protein ACEQUB_00703 [Ralstonia syzygii]